MRSMCGFLAACNGVLLPSDACGSSAHPSGMTMAYFMRYILKGSHSADTPANSRYILTNEESPKFSHIPCIRVCRKFPSQRIGREAAERRGRFAGKSGNEVGKTSPKLMDSGCR